MKRGNNKRREPGGGGGGGGPRQQHDPLSQPQPSHPKACESVTSNIYQLTASTGNHSLGPPPLSRGYSGQHQPNQPHQRQQPYQRRGQGQHRKMDRGGGGGGGNLRGIPGNATAAAGLSGPSAPLSSSPWKRLSLSEQQYEQQQQQSPPSPPQSCALSSSSRLNPAAVPFQLAADEPMNGSGNANSKYEASGEPMHTQQMTSMSETAQLMGPTGNFAPVPAPGFNGYFGGDFAGGGSSGVGSGGGPCGPFSPLPPCFVAPNGVTYVAVNFAPSAPGGGGPPMMPFFSPMLSQPQPPGAAYFNSYEHNSNWHQKQHQMMMSTAPSLEMAMQWSDGADGNGGNAGAGGGNGDGNHHQQLQPMASSSSSSSPMMTASTTTTTTAGGLYGEHHSNNGGRAGGALHKEPYFASGQSFTG